MTVGEYVPNATPSLRFERGAHVHLTSTMSMSARESPALSNAPRMASAGPMPMMAGSQPTSCHATTRAKGVSFLDARADSPATTMLRGAETEIWIMSTSQGHVSELRTPRIKGNVLYAVQWPRPSYQS